MPTYDYICTTCGNAWELEQRIVEDPIKQCPKCSAMTAKRQISAGAGFILKGGGWYADLYGSSKPSSSASKDDDKGSKTESKSDGAAKADAPKTESASKEGSGGANPPPDKGPKGSGDAKAA